MIWLGIIIGLILGAGGYYLYDRYWGNVTLRIWKLEHRISTLKAKAVTDVRKI